MLDVGEMNPRWVMWGVIKFRGDKSCWGCSAQNAGSLNNNSNKSIMFKRYSRSLSACILCHKDQKKILDKKGTMYHLLAPER